MYRRSVNVVTLVGIVCLLSVNRPALAGGQDVTLRFSDAKNAAPTDVHVSVQIQNPDGSWGSIIIPPTTIPPHATATQKRDLIKATLQGVFGTTHVTNNGANGLDLNVNVDNQIKVNFDPGATGESPDKVVCASTFSGTTAFLGSFQPFDAQGQPAVFTAGLVTDVGELTVQVSAEELNFQANGPLICQALFQRLAPQAPQFGAQINFMNDRLEIYFDPAYSAAQGGVIFGTTSPTPGCFGEVLAPALPIPGDLNCDGMVDFRDINPFVLLLSNPVAWQAAYPDCPMEDGDVNGDGSVSFRDINPFVALLSGG